MPSPGIRVTRWTTGSLLSTASSGSAERGADYPGSSHRTQPALTGARVENGKDRGRQGAPRGHRGGHPASPTSTARRAASGTSGTRSTTSPPTPRSRRSSTSSTTRSSRRHGELEELTEFLVDERDLHPVPGAADADPGRADLPDVDAAHARLGGVGASTPTGGTSPPEAQARKALRLIAKTASLHHHLPPPAHRAGVRAPEPALGARGGLPLDAARRGARPRGRAGCSTRRSSSTRTTR